MPASIIAIRLSAAEQQALHLQAQAQQLTPHAVVHAALAFYQAQHPLPSAEAATA